MVFPNASQLLRARNGLGYLTIISIQFGVQPLLVKQFIDKQCMTSSVVLCAEMAKVVGCLFIMFSDETGKRCFSNWKMQDCLVAAGIPSVTYLIQNYCVQVAYQNLDGVVFNVLNQSKVLFTALFSFLLNGRTQSSYQCVALLLVTAGGILVSLPGGSVSDGEHQENRPWGLFCAVLASGLSGLGSGITEWALQKHGRNSFLLSLELASMGCIILILTLLLGLSPDAVRMKESGFFLGWEVTTVIPAGGVRKVMATICGLILTCLLQQILLGMHLSYETCDICRDIESDLLDPVHCAPGGQFWQRSLKTMDCCASTLLLDDLVPLHCLKCSGELPSAHAVTDTLPAPPITPRGQRRGLEVLSRPKGSSEALDFLRALAKRFSKDLILRRMLKQCLAGSLEKTSRSADAGDYDLLLETKVLKRACPDKTPRAAEGLTEGRLKLKDPPGQNEGSFQLWLNADSERAGRFVNLLQTAGQVSQKMEKLMWKRARECHKRGARLCSTGPVVPARSRKEHDIPAFYLVEDTFAQICRKFGAHEAYVRFGPSYLSSTSHANTDVAFLMDRSFHAMELGGAIIDCPTQHAICKASSNEQESYKALEVQNGWHPQIALEEFHAGGSWWEVDLGRLHSCGGVRLQWILPQLKEVKYETRFVLRSDLRLEGGLGLPIKVADVAHGGPAFMAGVQPGDVLQLDAGGDGDEKFLEQPPMVVLTQLQEDAVQQPLRLFFKAPQMEPMGGSLKQKLKVTILASKAGEKLEQVQEQEITVSEKPCVVPAFFVGRQVRLQFGGAWPQMAGKALSVSVGILKVWRLAPPLFRQRFLDIFRKLERKSQKAGKLPPVPRFWSTAVHGQSFNMVINMDIVRKLRKSHDFKGDEQGALLKMAVKDKKEFHVLQTDETMALRQHLFAKDEDVRECTFHPQTAANVPRHVLAERDRISDRMDPEKITSIEDFVKEIGENYDGPKYAKYRHVRRHHMLSQAKSQYFKGALNDALTKLKSSFGVQQILDRFRCHHKGCGKQLDTSQNIKKCDRCSGFYCAQHKSKTVHNCEVMKEQIKAKAKKEAEEVGEGDKSRPPEENFDNKVEFGLLLEARDLAENIITALNKKEKEKVGLEHLGQSLASFGAVRILERPFRKQMCQSALERRRSSSQTATAKGRAPTPTPRLGSRSSSVDVKCKCSKAHSPSELRFPAAESVSRRVAWVKEAINQASKLSDVRPNSAAERSKRKKEEEERKKAPPPPPLPDKGTVKPRARSKPSATVKLEKLLKEKAADLQHAFGLCCEARVKLEANLVADAEQLIQQAKHLAEESLKEALAAAPQQGDAGKEGQAAVRHVEKQELRQMRVSLQQEAQETVELCTMLEEEVQMLRHQLLRPPAPPVPRLPSPPPRPPQWSPPPGSALWPPPSPTVVKALQDDAALMRLLVNACEIPPTTVTGPQKREMCLEFLEAGVCAKEQNCPFAHNPDELHGYEARWSPGEFNSAQHVADIDQMRLQAEQQRQQERLAQQAACAVVSDRSAAAEDDVSLRGLVETSFPATR
ncbi:unnamed protein product [Cladocopium goreaui]|uniref:PDZ domain-containing protein n=1 Tax=Cladocopium goreaui TaxID=2562237 RepID=A0A9P1C399_9DINO|nr:unnamed protein product [Cladocopium goreaui]